MFGWLRRSAAPPAPANIHVEPGVVIYAIGDIHGCADALHRLLEAIEQDGSTRGEGRRLIRIFLGDYIDRGLGSRDVLATLRRLHSTEPEQTRFLKGNHEAALLAFLDDPVAAAGWFLMGGAQTCESYGIRPARPGDGERGLFAARDRLREALGEDEAFLRERLDRWARSGEMLFVHAAVDPSRPISAQDDRSLLWGEAPGFLERRGLPGFVVVHGHTPGPRPVVTPWRICVDTGAFYSGRLTAARLAEEGLEFLAVGPTAP